MTYDGGTMEGPLCPRCGHLLPSNGECLIGHPSLSDLHVLDLSPEPGTLLYRPATVADLVSALRAEGMLVIEKVDDVLLDRVEDVVRAWAPDLNDHAMEQFIKEILDALAEAQPFPPAGGVS